MIGACIGIAIIVAIIAVGLNLSISPAGCYEDTHSVRPYSFAYGYDAGGKVVIVRGGAGDNCGAGSGC